MRSRVIACLLIVASFPAFARAQGSTRPDEEIGSQADAAFRRGVDNQTRILRARKDFSAATDAYLELHRRGIRNPALYLNLGNAALLADRWPEAIWAYHTGLQLDPNDRRLRQHLEFARGKVIYPLSGQGRLDADAWPTWLHRPTYFGLALLLAFAYTLGCMGITVLFFTHQPRVIGLTVAAVLLTAASGFGFWQAARQAETDRQTPLVVFADNTDFYRGNAVSYPKHPALPFVPRGLEARQVHRRGDWVQVRLITGEVGWVPRERVLVVEPGNCRVIALQ
jgi:hypothetical protein